MRISESWPPDWQGKAEGASGALRHDKRLQEAGAGWLVRCART